MNIIKSITCYIKGHEYEESYGFKPIGYTKKSRFYNNTVTLCGLQTCKRCGIKVELGK